MFISSAGVSGTATNALRKRRTRIDPQAVTSVVDNWCTGEKLKFQITDTSPTHTYTSRFETNLMRITAILRMSAAEFVKAEIAANKVSANQPRCLWLCIAKAMHDSQYI
jgi:hypothetical protein